MVTLIVYVILIFYKIYSMITLLNFRKVISEREKNNPEGTNTKTSGVIPFTNFTPRYSPGEFFKFYHNLLFDGGYLFPKPRTPSLKFNVHDPSQNMWEPNRKVGINTLNDMLATLCIASGKRKQTNHCLRATAGALIL